MENGARPLLGVLIVLALLSVSCGESAAKNSLGKETASGGSGPKLGAGGNSGSWSPPDLSVGGRRSSGSEQLGTCEEARAAKTTVGCDYYALHPANIEGVTYGQIAGSCYAVYVANTSPNSVDIQVEHDGKQLEVTEFARIPKGSGLNTTYEVLPDGKLPPQEVAILFLSSAPTNVDMAVVTCPAGIPVAYPIRPPPYNGKGPLYVKMDPDPGLQKLGVFHVVTSAPVVMYDIFPYGGGATALASASLLLPTSAWGTNYIGVDAGEQMFPWLSFVALSDDTRIEIMATADIATGTDTPVVPRGQIGVFSLKRGEAMKVAPPNPDLVAKPGISRPHLSGSVIQSNRPIGMWGGTNLLCVPSSEFKACDWAHQQMPPISALGSEYVGVRYRNRYEGAEEAPPWRVVGMVPNTELSYEPAPPDGAPIQLNEGQVVNFYASGPFVVRSQDSDHPFYMAAYMTACEYAGEKAGIEITPQFDCRGDPEFVSVVPAAQFLSKYIFFSDPTYPETNLVVVRKKANNAFADVTLDCAGPLANWQPIGNDYEYTRTDLVRHNFEKQGDCDNGRHSIESQGPFGVTVWGWGNTETGTDKNGIYSMYVSYAYPAGAGLAQTNQVVVPVVK